MVFRSTSFACPGCHGPLAAQAAIAWCHVCKGVWVSESELEERVRFVRGMNELDLAMVFERGHWSVAPVIRPCPLCRQPLGHASLGTVEIDRCGQQHGIWFDAGELESVLHASTAGVGVMVSPVELGPEEQVAIERKHTESSSSFGASDAAEAVGWVVAAIVDLLT